MRGLSKQRLPRIRFKLCSAHPVNRPRSGGLSRELRHRAFDQRPVQCGDTRLHLFCGKDELDIHAARSLMRGDHLDASLFQRRETPAQHAQTTQITPDGRHER